MAFLSRLERDHRDRLHLYPASEKQRLPLSTLVGKSNAEQIYACGPERLLDALEDATSNNPEKLHIEQLVRTSPVTAKKESVAPVRCPWLQAISTIGTRY